MNENLLAEIGLDKKMDESRQGEAFYSPVINPNAGSRKFYIESYGCAMNFNDSEIVASILHSSGFRATGNSEEADLILINTCSIREKAELTVRKRLTEFRKQKRSKPEMLVGILGCMAERLKSKLLEEEKLVDMVVGPDAYRDLPFLIETADGGQKAVNVLLSRDETYADINPVRLDSNGVSAFISITRGCDNMCSFCVVPFTRGRERSRDPHSIVNEAQELFDSGYREVTLLGQNVDSYLWFGGGLKKEFDKATDEQKKNAVNFANLLELVARVHPDLRIRFSTSHPKDITDEVLQTIARFENICDHIHLPVQSGSSSVLERMNRTYDREWYLNRVDAIKTIIPDCGISADIISGFCGETEEEHQETLSIMEIVRFDFAYMFTYSERPGTLAEKKYQDDVPDEMKQKRLHEIITLERIHSHDSNRLDVGKTYKVLVERSSTKSKDEMCGRNSQNKMVVFANRNCKPGDYVNVKITSCTSGTLLGEIL